MARVDTTTSGHILNGMYGALTRVFGGLWTRYGGWGWSRIRFFLPSARFDWEREAGDLWMNSIVGLAISWLGDRFHRPLIRVSKTARNGDFIPIGRHDAVDLWRRPNPWYGRRTMEKAIGLSLKVDGNAYIYKVRDYRGRLIQLWWIPHFRILPTWPSDGSRYIDGYRVWLDTAVYHLPPEDIIHIRDGIDPRNERLGLAALRASLREIVTVNYEGSYTAGILKNGGVPGCILTPVINDVTAKHVRMTEEGAKRVKEKFHEEFGVDQDKAGSVIVTNTPYEVKPVGFNPEQMALDKLPMNAIGRVCGALGVAPMSMGLPDPQKTYANLAEANRTSWGSIISVQELIAEELTMQLLPEFGLDPDTYVWEYDYSQIQELQESQDAVWTRVLGGFAGNLIRQNEGRELIGLEPDPDGDRYSFEILSGAQGEPDEDEESIPGIGVDLPKRMALNGSGRH